MAISTRVSGSHYATHYGTPEVTKVILLNGPKLCGKDIAITHLKSVGFPFVVREAKDSLHKITQQLFCVSEHRYWEIYNNRDTKELPLPDFHITINSLELDKLEDILKYSLDGRVGEAFRKDASIVLYYPIDLSVREAVIYVSELICKPRFGEEYFGKARANSIKDREIVIDGSCGFVEELTPLIERVGQNNILLIKIHRDGCNFDGDSRNYIPDGILKNTVSVSNNASEYDYLNRISEIVRSFLWRQ